MVSNEKNGNVSLSLSEDNLFWFISLDEDVESTQILTWPYMDDQAGVVQQQEIGVSGEASLEVSRSRADGSSVPDSVTRSFALEDWCPISGQFRVAKLGTNEELFYYFE